MGKARPEVTREIQRRFRAKHRDRLNAAQRARMKANPEKRYWAELKYLYGILPEQYIDLLEKQRGVCAICHRPERTRRRLSVDHDHDSGVIRGLLCTNCNAGIGNLGDNPGLLRVAAEYLEAAQNKN